MGQPCRASASIVYIYIYGVALKGMEEDVERLNLSDQFSGLLASHDSLLSSIPQQF